MAERVVRVKLTATMDQYVAAMGQAAKATRDVGAEGAKLAQTKQAFDMVGRSAMVAGGLVAAGLGVAIAKFADFDQAMSFVQAATRESAENMGLLRDAALEAGATTVFSATESANAIEELGKAGLSTADILGGGLKGSLDLAAAGGLGVAEAAGISATALKTFKLEGDQATHVADLLAAGAGKAMGDVADLGMALNQAGLVAESTGLSIEETTGSLAAFASKGLLGSDAGTSFKAMLQRLTPQSKEAKDKMDELGISAYDASGQFVGMEKFAGNLETSLADLTDEQRNSALATIFGSDAVRAANVLYSEGESGIRQWINAVDDTGYASEQAAIRLDNLKGDWEALMGAVDSALIGMGEAADGPLRGLVTVLTSVVDGFNGLPAGAQQAAFWIAAAGSAALVAGGAYLLGVPKVAAYNAALATMGGTAQRTGRILGAVGKGVGIASVLAIGLPLLVEWSEQLEGTQRIAEQAIAKNKDLASSLQAVNGGMKFDNLASSFKGLVQIQENGFNRLGAIWDSSIETGIDLEARLGDLNGELGSLAKSNLPAAQAQFQKWALATDGSKEQLLALLNSLPDFRNALQESAKASGGLATDQELVAMAMEGSAGKTKKQKDSLEDLQGVANDTVTAIGTLEESIRNFGTAQFDTERASIDFQQSLQDLTDTLTDGDGNLVGSLDASTEAGRNTLSAMLDVAQSTNDYAASVAAMGGSTEEVQGILEAGRQKIIDTRLSLGDTEQAAKDYADQLISTPANIETAVKLSGVELAQQRIESFISNYNGRSITLGLTAETITGNPSLGYPGNAEGGAIYGPGSGTSDSVIRRLSNGEHVWTAAEVNAAGGQAAMYEMRRSVMQYGTATASSNISNTAPMSLDGMAITGTLDLGNGLTGFVDGRIVQKSRETTTAIQNGRR